MDKPAFRRIFRFARAALGLGACVVALAGCENIGKTLKSGASGGSSEPENKNAPKITSIANVTVNQDQVFSVSFAISDPDGGLDCRQSMYVNVDNPDLLPPNLIERLGTAPNCTFRFHPGAGYWGTATVQLEVYDGKNKAQTSFTVTVLEGAATPTVSGASVSEGNAAVFTVRLSHAMPGPKTFTYATADGTAVAGTNYTAASGSVTFAAGETVKTVSVSTTHDNVNTADLVFGLVVNMDGITRTATGAITNIDGLPTASAADVSAGEGASLTFTVSLNRASSSTTSVTYATANGTAVAGVNYTAASGTLTFTPGQTSKTVTIATLDDGVIGSDNTMMLSLTANGVTRTATGTITDVQGPAALSVADVTVNEGASAVFTVNLNHASTSALAVTYATANGTAVAGTNYTSTSGSITFSPGQTSKTITVPTVDEGVYTPSLTFTLSLSLAGVSTTATGNITNIDSAPKATAAAASANEGSSVAFTVTLDRSSSAATSVTYSTTNGTAMSGTNYTSSSGILTVPAGQTTATLSVPTLHDSIYTSSLNFTLSLTAGGATNTATGTVVDTDGAPTASVSAASANEGSNLDFTVTLNHASASSTAVTYASADGTAVAGTNYTAVSGTLTFLAGETSKVVTVPSAGDSKYAPSLTFTLSATAGGVTNSGTGTIVNTDAAPAVSAANVSANEGANLVFAVTLDRAATTSTTVTYATSDVTAKAGVNYTSSSGTLTFLAGETTKHLTIVSLADSKYAPDVTFTLSLTTNGVMYPATGTIVNTDTQPTVSVSADASSVTEGGTAIFHFTLDHASAVDVQVSYATANGSATGGSDFAASSGTATISAGTLTSGISVVTYDDSADETDETFTMQITSAVNATLGTTSASETIQDTALLYDFTAGSLPTGLTFTRAGSATYYDSSGTLQTAGTNAARFDYNPGSCAGTCAMRGLLIEESRTNLLLQSSDYNSTWVNNGCTLTAGATASPTGAADAFSVLAMNAAANADHVTQSVMLSASTTYTLSFYVKNSSSTKSTYEVSAANSGTTGKTVDLTWTGAVPSVSGGTAQALPNGWYRVATTFTTNAADAGAADVNFYPSPLAQNGVAYLWGAQLEAGATPTSYIATTTATATRAGDGLAINGFSGWFNATAWTAILDFSRPAYEASTSAATPTMFSACDDSSGGACASDNFEAVYVPSDNTFRGRATAASSMVATSNYANGANLTDVKVQMGVSQASSGALQAVVNGTAATASAGAAKPNLSSFLLGASGLASAPTKQVNGHLKKFTYRSRTLTSAQLQALTSD